MLLFPYKADVDLGRWPVLTLIVCAVCIWVFARQAISEHKYSEALSDFCNRQVTRDELLVLRYVTDDPEQHYCNLMLEIRDAPDPKRAMLDLAESAKPTPFYRNKSDSTDYIYSVLSESSRRFERAVPKNLTDELHYDPNTLNVGRMITAAFSHGDWWHLISNLIFFFAFAASVEVIAGYLYFLGFILLSAIGTHLAYAYSVAGVEGALPTVGLSGVVMAMMAFLAMVAPTLSIRCFFWFLIIVRTFRVPALAIAALYIVQNIFDYANRDPNDNVNYVAHISGAAIGVAMGLVYKIRHREFIRDLLPGI
jgi:membrane associated rhomboid family serine protease